jgi:hypothetical protein
MSADKSADEDAVAGPTGDGEGESPEPQLEHGVKVKFDEVKRRAYGLESTLDAHVEAAEREAERRGAAIVADAERRAEEARDEAQAQVDAARQQVNELMRLRQALFASLRDSLGDFEEAIARSEENRSFTEAAAVAAPESPDLARADRTPEPAPAPSAAIPTAPPRPEPDETDAEPSPQAGGPTVEVRVEPLPNLHSAEAVERAFEALPIVHGVRLRSFEGKTALLEADGVDVNMLLGSMRAHLPVPFILRDAGPGRLAVQVGELPPGT